MYAMVIMHNMVIEAQGRLICPYVPSDPRPVLFPMGSNEYRHRTVDIHDEGIHDRLHEDLAMHIYNNPRNVVNIPPVGIPDPPPGVPPVGEYNDVPDYELPVDSDDDVVDDEDDLEDYDDVVDDD